LNNQRNQFQGQDSWLVICFCTSLGASLFCTLAAALDFYQEYCLLVEIGQGSTTDLGVAFWISDERLSFRPNALPSIFNLTYTSKKIALNSCKTL